MLRTRVFWITSIMVLVAADAFAQDLPPVLSLQDALQLARSRNPSLAATLNEVEMAEADRLQASRRLNPAVTTTRGLPPL